MRHNKLTEMREIAGMTQKELAEAVGVSQQSIYYYEHGDRDPRASMLKKLADALGCSISDILDVHAPESVSYSIVDLSDPNEREIAKTVKRLDTEDKEVVLTVAKALARKRQ